MFLDVEDQSAEFRHRLQVGRKLTVPEFSRMIRARGLALQRLLHYFIVLCQFCFSYTALSNRMIITVTTMIGMIKSRGEMQRDTAKAVCTFIKIFEDKSKWPLHSGKWHRLKSPAAFLTFEQAGVEVLDLYSNSEPLLLHSLALVFMPALKQLNLKNNKICSVEALRDLDCPSLQTLNLADNNLTRVTRALNKAGLPALRRLILYANNIVELWDGPHFLCLGAASEENCLQELILGLNRVVDMKWLNKLPLPSTITRVSVQNNRAHGVIHKLTSWAISQESLLI